MHKTVLAATVALLTTLWLSGAALAAGLPSHRVPDGRAPATKAATWAAVPRAGFQTLGAKLAGTAVLNGHIYTYSGTPVEGGYVYAEAYDDGASAWTSAESSTDVSGAYSLANLAAANQAGYLFASSPAEPWSVYRYSATWADPGPTTFDFRAGLVTTTAVRGSVWPGWDYIENELFGYDAASNILAESYVFGGNSVVVGDSYAPGGSYDTGAMYFWSDQGMEYYPAAGVTAGMRSAQSVNVSQDDAQRIFVTAPYWASGKPGTTATIRHWNFPADWKLQFWGWPDAPTGGTKNFGTAVAPVTDPFSKKFKIPTTAPAGYQYRFQTDHADGPLLLTTPFQVCTLKATKTAIRRGARIKLSGVIPTQGHWGSTPGKTKYVTIYKRTKSVSSAPTVWDATRKGWTKVARVKANGLGKYASAYLKPTRTTWYVVRYPGDDWYWDAYTSVLKVRVY